ncbi:MAG: ABC transporter ATP-binding protein [Saprospiraceae bacterium]|nr:ABC transporter ATP-binding protein [Saprospiraceae bacterium]
MIKLNKIGKRFRYEWIFRDLSTTFEQGRRYAVLGPNGVGKSTLMKILSGHLSPSEGKMSVIQDGKILEADAIYRHVSYAAPYIDLIEEFTLTEAIDFHAKFHPLSKSMKINDLIDILGFQKSKDKEIRYFSSGMRQRLKLALAICSDSPFLLLDEPTTNLDVQGVAWYRRLMQQYTEGSSRLVVIASNAPHDYDFCDATMNILDYKKAP